MFKQLRKFIPLSICLFSTLTATQALDWTDPKWHWMDEQIEEQLGPFRNSGITLSMLSETMHRIPEFSRHSHCRRHQIINRQVFGPEGEAKALLEKIAKLYPVPDVDVFINLDDIIWLWWIPPTPILTTCKIRNDAGKLIHFPVQIWEPWETYFTKNIEIANENSPWESKVPKLIWRGQFSGSDHLNNQGDWIKIPRGKICYLSQQYPDIIDATISIPPHAWVVSEEVQKELFRQFPLKTASWEEYLHHKYLLDLDGYVASTPGCAWKLLSNCAVFKHDSRYTLWFYRILQPWVHYIPVETHLNDLLDKIQWAREHDAETKQIADNARQLAKENIMPEHLYLYCYKVLVKYASLQRFQPIENPPLDPLPSQASSKKTKKHKNKKHKKKRWF